MVAENAEEDKENDSLETLLDSVNRNSKFQVFLSEPNFLNSFYSLFGWKFSA